MLDDPSVPHTVDVHVVDREAASGWGQHAHGRVLECSRVGSATRNLVNHGVSADNLIVDLEP